MTNRLFEHINRFFFVLLTAAIILLPGCHSTRYLTDNQYLLKKNKVVFTSPQKIENKGEIKDNLSKTIQQKPNKYTLVFFPVKLTTYNRRYSKLRRPIPTKLPKSVEPPAILDTAAMRRTTQAMKIYLYNQGFFYATVKDTFNVKHHKAFATYTVNTGINYLINNVNYVVDDSAIAKIVNNSRELSSLKKGKAFTYGLLAEERSRITAEVRNNGYYRFSQENVNFIKGLDTLDKTQFKDVESPFEGAIHFISAAKRKTKHTIDIDVFVQLADDTSAYTKYKITGVHVYPDYVNATDLGNSKLKKTVIDSIDFNYHNNYIHSNVLYKHIYLSPGSIYSQADHDKTQAKLTELGIFQYIRLLPRENRRKGTLDYDILLNRAKKYDFSTLYELSSGSTYALGHSLGINLRDRNFLKGANMLTIGVNGGLELSYNPNLGKNFFDHFDILTRYYGINASIDFPKFLAPIASSLFDNTNLPHTIIGGGENVIERINYYTLANTSVNFFYSWRQTQNITWTLSPAFVNVIRVPVQTDSFKKVLENNAYLRNSYKENFIEGENISFTFDNTIKKHYTNYSFLKLGLEEAGGILGVVNKLGVALNDLYKIQYAQYLKFDFDARHYFTFTKSVFAVRFVGGVGIPLDKSSTLPYIKQYFAGGSYSLRGWRIRTLGPGSFYDQNNINKTNQIDRTGDIKLELNSEYRFPITPLFAGAVKMNGALFADAGNIWLAQSDPSYPGGDLTIGGLGQDIAADLGFGTRFDIASFLTLRIDVAMPVKKPYVHTNSGWVFKEIDIYNSSWRSDNIIFNISIGYPF
jgi:outer membrane protein insertion porin family